MKTNIRVGDKVEINCKESWANGEWGIVKHRAYGLFYVAIANDVKTVLCFEGYELKKIK